MMTAAPYKSRISAGGWPPCYVPFVKMKCSCGLPLPLLRLSITGRLLFLCEGIMWQSPPARMAAVQFGHAVKPSSLTTCQTLMESWRMMTRFKLPQDKCFRLATSSHFGTPVVDTRQGFDDVLISEDQQWWTTPIILRNMHQLHQKPSCQTTSEHPFLCTMCILCIFALSTSKLPQNKTFR